MNKVSNRRLNRKVKEVLIRNLRKYLMRKLNLWKDQGLRQKYLKFILPQELKILVNPGFHKIKVNHSKKPKIPRNEFHYKLWTQTKKITKLR